MTRAIIVGSLVFLVALLFTPFTIQSIAWVVFFAVLVTAAFGLLGLLSAIWAEKFDHLAIFPNFVLLPLAFLGGVFYSIEMLPEPWQTISRFNPLLYMVNGMRFGFFGVADVSPWQSAAVVLISFVALAAVTATVLSRGYKLRL